jgi:hypothetical protein
VLCTVLCLLFFVIPLSAEPAEEEASTPEAPSLDEAVAAVTREMRILRPSDKMLKYLDDCITYAEKSGILLRSISDRISLC